MSHKKQWFTFFLVAKPTTGAKGTVYRNADELSFIAPQAKFILFYFFPATAPDSFFVRAFCALELDFYIENEAHRERSSSRGRKKKCAESETWVRDAMPARFGSECCVFPLFLSKYQISSKTLEALSVPCEWVKRAHAENVKLFSCVASWKYHINQHSYKSVWRLSWIVAINPVVCVCVRALSH